MFIIAIVVGFVFFIISWIYIKITTPPKPKLNYEVTAPRVRLKDGRYMAIKEQGVPKDKAKFKVIVAHGFNSSKDGFFQISQEFLEKEGIYIVVYDRAGYAESDPNPNRDLKSDTFDLEEVADILELGTKFYVLGLSLANYITWGCLKYIPHRLSGVLLIVPLVNYWWPSFPAELAKKGFKKHKIGDQIATWLSYHAPQFLYWWTTQNWFHVHASGKDRSVYDDSKYDNQILNQWRKYGRPKQHLIKQQGVYHSLVKDMAIMHGKWEFDPMELPNPFPQNEGSVHIWQGTADKAVHYSLQRFIVKKLPWIKYHEVPHAGHLLPHYESIGEQMFRSFLLGEDPIISLD